MLQVQTQEEQITVVFTGELGCGLFHSLLGENMKLNVICCENTLLISGMKKELVFVVGNEMIQLLNGVKFVDLTYDTTKSFFEGKLDYIKKMSLAIKALNAGVEDCLVAMDIEYLYQNIRKKSFCGIYVNEVPEKKEEDHVFYMIMLYGDITLSDLQDVVESGQKGVIGAGYDYSSEGEYHVIRLAFSDML